MVFIRKVKTASGATAVQIARKKYGRIVQIEHIGSAHNQEELETLLSLAIEKLIENRTGMSIRRFVNTLCPIRSGIVSINDKEYPAEAEITSDVTQILRRLSAGH